MLNLLKRPASRGEEKVSDYFKFFMFKHQMKPEIIQGGFWIVLLVIVVGNSRSLFSGGDPMSALLSIVIGCLIARFFCELLVILFRIHDTLLVIEKNSAAK